MSLYQYTAVAQDGRAVNGSVEAASLDEARELLGQMPLQVTELGGQAPPKPPRGSIGRAEFRLFNEQLASVTRANIPLDRGLRQMAADVQGKRLRRLLEAIADDLERGVDPEEAFGKHERHFPPLYGRIIRAGIRSGRLPEMLMSLNRHMDFAGQTRRIVLEAISYPLLVAVLALGVLTVIFRFVVPQVVAMLTFDGAGMVLPAITRLFLAAADAWPQTLLILGLIFGGGAALLALMGRTSCGRVAREKFMLVVPVLRRIYHNGLLSRLADSMGLLITGGCDLPEAFRLSSGATGSELMMRRCGMMAELLEHGDSVLDAGELAQDVIPPVMLLAIQSGAARNELPDNLYILADTYRRQAKVHQQRLGAILMPALLLTLGGFMAMAIMAIFLPLIGALEMLGM